MSNQTSLEQRIADLQAELEMTKRQMIETTDNNQALRLELERERARADRLQRRVDQYQVDSVLAAVRSSPYAESDARACTGCGHVGRDHLVHELHAVRGWVPKEGPGRYGRCVAVVPPSREDGSVLCHRACSCEGFV